MLRSDVRIAESVRDFVPPGLLGQVVAAVAEQLEAIWAVLTATQKNCTSRT